MQGILTCHADIKFYNRVHIMQQQRVRSSVLFRYFPIWKAAALVLALLGGVAFSRDYPSRERFQSLRQSFGSGQEKVDLLADRAEYELDGHWATFIGNVVIRSGGQELRADRVRFNTETHDAQAVGRVTLVGPEGSVWSGETLSVNLKERSGTAGNVDVYYEPFRINAAQGEVIDDVYVAHDVLMTTCTNAPGRRHYEILARRLRLRPGHSAVSHHAVGYLFGVPFFYWPYYYKDLKRHYGLRFEPGYRGRWGAYLLSAYKALIYHDEDDRWIDSRTSLDWRYKRGVAYGQRFNWYLQELGDGWLSGYILNDKKDPLPYGVEEERRYRIRLNHALSLSERDRILLQGLYVSDTEVMKDFFEKEHREMLQPENYLSYAHIGRDFALGIIARPRLNTFFDQVERLPEAWFNLNQREIGDTGLYYESRNAAAFLRKQFDERRDPKRESYDAMRLDTFHQLNYPLKFGGFLNLIPRASYRGTYYSESVATRDETQTVIETTTNALGRAVTISSIHTNSVAHDAGSAFRNVLEFGMETSFKAYSMWTASGGTPWRHVVEPYANYTYIPEPDVRPHELYQFDTIDTIDFTHQIRLGLRNFWQYKKGNRILEAARIDVFGDVLLEPEDHQKTVERIYLDSEFRPAQWMRWDVEGTYRTTDSELEKASVRMQLWHERFSTTCEYLYRVDASSLATGELTWSMTPEWAINLYGRYEFETAQVEEVGGYLQRKFDCIAFRVYSSVLPGYKRSDGSEERDDFRISFTAWLTHFPPDRILESDFR